MRTVRQWLDARRRRVEDDVAKEWEKLMEGWSGDTWTSDSTNFGPHTPTITKPKLPADPLDAFDDADLILKLIERGYAVWKPPVGE